MRPAVLVLAILLAAATSTASQTFERNGRSACYGLVPSKLSIKETPQGKFVITQEGLGQFIDTLSFPVREDAEAALEILKKHQKICAIGLFTYLK